MAFEVDTVTLPAFLACAFINDDRSGLTDEDEEILDEILDLYHSKGWRIVDVARDENGDSCEPYFTWNFRLYHGRCAGGDVLDYTIHIGE